MSGPTMMMHLMLERLSRRASVRVPEAESVMRDRSQNEAFRDAGRDEGILAFLYLYHSLQITSVICPGDTVLDLACGPANQLAQVAVMNPRCRFIGLDASPSMLQEARATLQRLRVTNAELVQADMTDLSAFRSESVDCVVCTMSLHHLPDTQTLAEVMREIGRVLRREGGLYIADFGRLKRPSTQRYFAQDWQREQSAGFTQEYLQSLRAAFSVEELTISATALGCDAECVVTPVAPFMVLLRSRPRHAWDAEDQRTARHLHSLLEPGQRTKFRALARWFRAAGCHLPLILS